MYFWIYFNTVTHQFKMDIDQIKMDIQNRMLDEKTDIFYKFLKRNVDCPNVDQGLKTNAEPYPDAISTFCWRIQHTSPTFM